MDVVSLALALGSIGLIMFILGKLRLVTKLALVFLALVFTFILMAVIPALQIEPIYSLLKGFFDAIPGFFGKLIGYFEKLLGGLANG